MSCEELEKYIMTQNKTMKITTDNECEIYTNLSTFQEIQ